jgi:ribonuclease D
MRQGLVYRYLIDPDDAREWLTRWAGISVLGLDTETFRDDQQNQLSLLQLAAPTGEVVVLDGLTAGIEAARFLMEDPEVLLVAHNARFDEGVLRGYGFAVEGMVDTLKLSRRTLSLSSHSLASVAHHLFGISLDKQWQRSDWRRRPLEREQLDYAALDAVIALRVFEAFAERLEGEGRWGTELQRARLRPPGTPKTPDPGANPAPDRPPQFRPLTSNEQRLYVKLEHWRAEQASREQVPLYFICPDRTLHQLAIDAPRSLDQLIPIFGLGPLRIARYGQALLTLLER